ncbi:MAG: hypothetical protein WC780_13280 [Lentimicrobiaceae bacterium]|jgi:hypothetical protein
MKNKIVFISAVTKEKTPVLENMISSLQSEFKCLLVIYKHKEIFSFIKSSLSYILKTKSKKALFFVGIQSLPILFLTQFLNNEKYYWALENYKFKLFNSSLSQKILFFEYLICWRKITLIVPSKYRAAFYNSKQYKNTIIIENTQPLGKKFKNRILDNKKVKFVMYGRLSNDDIYLEEFIRIVGKFQYLAELHLIGWDFLLSDLISPYNNIFYHGSIEHSSLISFLDEFDVSIIGYRPYKFNNKYCAPNKLYEAFSISLPVLANTLNPPLFDIISTYKCGVLTDFSNLDEHFEIIINELRQNYDYYKSSCYKAYVEKYNFDNYYNQLALKAK